MDANSPAYGLGTGIRYNLKTSYDTCLSCVFPGNRSFVLNNSKVDLNQSVSSAWVASDITKGKVDAKNLLSDYSLSVNSLDVVGEHLVCGTDAEAIYITRNLQV